MIEGLGKLAPEEQWPEWRKRGEDPGSLAADPKFVNAKKHDYRLRKNSPAFALGFQAIPVEKIGPYKDELRASWPIVEAEGVREKPVVSEAALPPAPPPPRNTTPFVAARVAAPVTVDGVLAPNEWPAARMALKESPNRAPIAGQPCTAAACHDGSTLYVAVSVPATAAKLKLGTAWGQDDGAEVCFQNLSAGKPGPVLVLHSFAAGACYSVADGGAPAATAKTLGDAVRFAAKADEKGWTGEWAIPLAAAGIVPKSGAKLAFNLGVRRTETDEWVIWVGALGATWQLDNAGYLVLE
jgi:hypothetical protein